MGNSFLNNVIFNLYNSKKEYDEAFSKFIDNLDEKVISYFFDNPSEKIQSSFIDYNFIFDNIKKFMENNETLSKLSDDIKYNFPKYGETRVKDVVINTFIENYLDVKKENFDETYEMIDEKYEIIKNIKDAGFCNVIEKEKVFDYIIDNIKKADLDLYFDPQEVISNMKKNINVFENDYKDVIINNFNNSVNKGAKVLSKLFSNIAKKTEKDKED